MTTPLLSVQDLRIAVTRPDGKGETRLVDGVSFTLAKGRILGLIGESGAGKSTIGLASLGYTRGTIRITGGTIHLTGTDVRALKGRALRSLRGTRVAYVAQSAALAFNPAQRLGEQVIEASLRHRLLSRAAAEARAVALFTTLGLPDPQHFGARFPHQVSGGQLQRAMTAMALCPGPDLLIFDEPTTALDVTTQIEVLAAIRRAIRDTGTAALYISHDLAVVAQIADEVMVLRGGKMVEHGPVRAVIETPAEDYTRALMTARSPIRPPATGIGEPLLAVAGLTARFANHARAIEDLSFTIAKGRTLAVVGESGSGKSTLARVLTGLLPATGGTLDFAGVPLPRHLRNRGRDHKRRIQLIHQMADAALNPRQTVRDLIGRPLTLYYGLRGRTKTARVVELLADIELGPEMLSRYPAELSGGQRQRVAIARALAARPDLVICDEPTSALDPLVAVGILRLLDRLQQETGVAYLLITHDLAVVRAMADDVAVMRHGRLVRSGPIAEALTPPYDPYTARLMASVPELRIGWLDDILAARSAAVDCDP